MQVKAQKAHFQNIQKYSLLGLGLVFWFIIAFSVQAAEINPADHIKPDELQPKFESMRDNSQLNQAISDSTTHQIKKSEPSWWGWLTNSSRKPANFHYIDIIELLD